MTSVRLTETSERLLSGLSIGESIASGPVKLVHDASEIDAVSEGDILVTQMTQPDWVPVMKKAKAIVTEEGDEPVTPPS